MTTSANPIWAAFDFDGTLTRCDTFTLFLRNAAGTRWTSVLLRESPLLLLHALHLLPTDVAKQRMLKRCLGGCSESALRSLGDQFVAERIPGLIRPETFALFEEHKRQGHTCVLISASLDLYLEQWARQAGFDHLICTKLQVAADGAVIGNFDGGNCNGPEKARRLRQILPDNAILYAYGNGKGDRELLAMAQHRYYRNRWVR